MPDRTQPAAVPLGADAPTPAAPARELTYSTYLRLDELLHCQTPLSEAHDELLFIVIHQVYELWFKQILHEIALLQQRLTSRDGATATSTARRIAKILKTVVAQMDVLETMTPRQFAAFRPELGSASGFQSNQFRVLEAALGRRDFDPDVVEADPQLLAAVNRPSVLQSLLEYLGIGDADEAQIDQSLVGIYRGESSEALEVCEALVDIDEGLQEWRYRHLKMVERVIGAKVGTGGSAGAGYLRSTLFRPVFPRLWDVRSVLD